MRKVHTTIIEDLLDGGYVPVIAPIGVGEDGESYNINADYVAAELAGALEAEKLLLLTDIEGIYKDFDDKSSFISTLHQPEARNYIKDGTIDMIATDHAPHSLEEKSKGFDKSSFGVVGLETSFAVSYTQLVKKDVISFERLVELMSVISKENFI